MRLSIYLFILFFTVLKSFSAPPTNDNIVNAQELYSLTGYCSADAAYTNVSATSSGYKKGRFWSSEGKDIWYKFTAIKTDISITVSGRISPTSINTLIDPLIAIYTYDGTTLTEMIGSMNTSGNSTNAYKGGLTTGHEYYIRISAEDNHTGTFKLCINNYNPATKPGQDCSTASILCNKEPVSELRISGSGNNNQEAAGTCLQTESNSAWYKWTADDDGTLTFSITPSSNTDDIDWVLYDLGPNGDCSNVTAANAIRCAAGNGISCNPGYYITGLNLTSTDVSEQRNCPPGQDGFLKYVDMIAGHNYALLIDNFSSGNNGFILSFGGTGVFRGPKTPINVIGNDLCSSLQSYTFSAGTGNYKDLLWNFGDGASPASAAGAGPHLVTYSTTGQKSITLEATNALGCTASSYYNLLVAQKPARPLITASQIELCIGQVLKLSTPEIENGEYHWTGPDFSSSLPNPEIPITGPENAGDYKLTVQVGTCQSEEAILAIPAIPKKVTAAFYTDIALTSKYAIPVSVNFINQSVNASAFFWNFGDNHTSTDLNPNHTYTTPGNYNISLTAYTTNQCADTVVSGKLVILKDAALLIPNAFSPNGDGINDEFQINLANIKDYHIVIVNRWGTKVFENTDIFANWNGKYNQQDLPSGVYYYLILGKDLNRKSIKYSGYITLLR